ncbi:bacteriocin immunity protein [Deinococcus cellulosilyticus]|uniref:Uncharacterized protein n=1 Tax=Deinococcus cellulosilyticus (strain DSM 18568 / NBRC 106333 / KACC 11606 / 5516J-15) TaxID=1223518 RepID=A0A511N826_DEIC1|nr:bacteriocin immunity protein [Deinococcus cellulosilyticus]GEM48581.1 hypothetical protein DC3_42160 [Deinococcus cellulosilyticus NBRC 106333 = KACC 11606]
MHGSPPPDQKGYHGQMNIRPHLLPPELDLELVGQVAELAADLQDEPENPESSRLLEFNRLTGQNYTHSHFRGLSGSIDAHDFAEIALSPVDHFEDVQDEEFLEIIRFLLEGLGSERDLGYWLEFLQRHLPHPSPSDLIFQAELSPEDILHQLKTYPPIVL